MKSPLAALRHLCLGSLLAIPLLAAAAETALPAPGGNFPLDRQATAAAPSRATGDLRLALLHFDPVPGDVAGNRARIEQAIREAVGHGADWVITPELAETGYNFVSRIGTGWIAPFPDDWIGRLAAIARDQRVALFVGFAERDAATGKLHNSVAVIDRSGKLLGTYRKQRVHGGVEDWSVAGSGGAPFVVDGVAVGTLICADAYAAEPAARLADQGAEILLVPANWPSIRGMGPGDVWERRTLETGLPLIAVNRGGSEPELDFSNGETVVSLNGERLHKLTAPNGGIFYIDWDRRQRFRSVRP